jgi:hypothetical protein
MSNIVLVGGLYFLRYNIGLKSQKTEVFKGTAVISEDINKQTPWALVCKRTIPTELPPLIGEI